VKSPFLTPTLAAFLGLSLTASAVDLLSPSDFIIALDADFAAPASSYPDPNERPALAIDGTLSKYLNFGGAGSGFIVSPAQASIVQSFQITTANDAQGRDPSGWVLWGTTDGIVSADNSDGSLENWVLIASGGVTLPVARDTAGPFVSFANSELYASYKMTFPRLSGEALMQIAEVQFYSEANGGGSTILAPSNPIIAIDTPAPQSGYPGNEVPMLALDNNPNTKYLNFGRENSGFIVTPGVGSSIVNSFRVTTAGDVDGRDPSAWQIFGTNETIASYDNGTGTDEGWTLIASGGFDNLTMPLARLTTGADVTFTNSEAYASYKVIFTENRGPDGGAVNSIQFADIQFGGTVVPEPGSAALALLGAGALAARRRRRA
jgi:MYXO-CTERM domain-containing protein